MRRLFFPAVLAAFMLLTIVLPSQAQDTEPSAGEVIGQVSGRVLNLTTDGESLSGTRVVLYALEDFSPRATFSTTVTSDGGFVFESIGLVPGYSYIATLDYQNVAYGSSFIEYDGGANSIDLEIEVYEAVTSADPIRISRLHVLVDFAEGWMRVSELYIFDNLGDRVYTGPTGNPDEGTLEFPLPEGVQRPTIERAMGEGMVPASNSVFETSTGYVDTLPVRPGPASQQVMVSYEVAYQDDATISHPLLYPAGSVSLILPDIGLNVESDVLTGGGPQAMQGTSFVEWEARDIPAGGTLSFTVSGQPDLEALAASRNSQGVEAPSTAPARESPLFVSAGDNGTTWAVGIGSLVVAGGVAVFVWNRSQVRLDGRQRGELLQAIVDLDASHERGSISRARYEFEREMLKAELRNWYEES